MNRSMSKAPARLVPGLPLLLVAVLGGGCCSGPPYEVKVVPDEGSLKNPSTGIVDSVSTDLIPIQKTDVPYWEKISVTNYFTSGTPENMKRVELFNKKMLLNFMFSQGNLAPRALPVDDPRWKEMDLKGLNYLVVLADLPDPSPSKPWEDRPGQEDPRRRIIPVDCDHWDCQTIELQVQRSGLQLVTKMIPDK